MKLACLAVVTLLVFGCAPPPGSSPKLIAGPDGQAHQPIEFAGGPIYRIGEALQVASYVGGTSGTLTFKNVKTDPNLGKTTPWPVAPPALQTARVLLGKVHAVWRAHTMLKRWNDTSHCE